MIYAAKIVGQGTTAGTFLVTPQYTRIDGVSAPNIEALPINGLVPAIGDVVYCAEGANDFEQSMQLLINDNGGAYPIIFASLAATIEYNINLTIDGNFIAKGKATLGAGGKKMVLGDPTQTWAQAVDAALTALYAWAATGVPPGPAGGITPFPGTPALQPWQTANLSSNHQLD